MADALDVISFEDAQRAINMRESNSDHDEAIAMHVTAISRLMDATVGPVVQREVVEVLRSGTSRIELSQQPVASIDVVREASGSTITELEVVAFGAVTDGWYADPWYGDPLLFSGVLTRRYGGSIGSWTGDQVEVTYTAGRFENTASVDARFKDTAGQILRRLWKRESSSWAQSPTFLAANDGEAEGFTGFFRVAKPIIEEMLWDQMPLPGVA